MPRLLSNFLLASSAVILSPNAQPDTSLIPPYDERCNAMKCHAALINPINDPSQIDYFNKPIPKNIHQIWFGKRKKSQHKKREKWERYADQFEWDYKLWTEDDDPYVATFMKEENFLLMQKMRQKKNYCAASDILRCEILKQFGGLYVDVDLNPPTQNNRFVPIEKLMNMRGLTVVTEKHSRNIDSTALFVTNAWLLAPKNHPVMNSMVDQFYENTHHWYEENKTHEAMFITGPFLLSKILSGSFNVVPSTYLTKFHVAPSIPH